MAAETDGAELRAVGSREAVAACNASNTASATEVSGKALAAGWNYAVLEGISVVTLLVGFALAFVLSPAGTCLRRDG
ncbi:MAG: hypothetical protein AB1461_01475 [Thermodesulfobacteriota bacterium]